MMKKISRKRHIAKTLTWRIVATIDTIVVSWIISRSINISVAIGGAEVLTKVILYYFHERAWYHIRLFDSKSSKIRHIIKSVTWRLVGTMDTIFMGWLISGNPTIGLKVGAFELFTKIAIYYIHERIWYRTDFGLIEIVEEYDQEKLLNRNVYSHDYEVSRLTRNSKNGHDSFMVLFTGLSGSGKSTLSNLIEKELNHRNIKTYLLDGDNVRLGINKDLGFSEEDRTENLRRIAEISKLFIDSGTLVLAAFVSPLKKDREMIRQIVGNKDFIEVFISTPLEECEKRDVKGLYAKARRGEISNFTGINAPYERPDNPHIEINTLGRSIEDCAKEILHRLEQRLEMSKLEV
jgi:adenylylsulfate kinase